MNVRHVIGCQPGGMPSARAIVERPMVAQVL
jgi:hypothetical protein